MKTDYSDPPVAQIEVTKANCDVYCALYQWYEMMQYSSTPGTQGICPAGWHLPVYDDFFALIEMWGGYPIAGGPLKTTGTIEQGNGLWVAPNTGATNSSGFSGIPGGGIGFSTDLTPEMKQLYQKLGLENSDEIKSSNNLGTMGCIWDSEPEADVFFLFNSSTYTFIGNTGPSLTSAFSVRCLKD